MSMTPEHQLLADQVSRLATALEDHLGAEADAIHRVAQAAAQRAIEAHLHEVPHSSIPASDARLYVAQLQSLILMQDKLEDLIDGPEVTLFDGTKFRDHTRGWTERFDRLEADMSKTKNALSDAGLSTSTAAKAAKAGAGIGIALLVLERLAAVMGIG